MSAHHLDHPLQPGDHAPNFVLNAISREGTVALDDFRGRLPLLVGLFRGLMCPFCRRHVAAMAQFNPVLREKGVESLAVVNTPVERARLYFQYHPIPGLLAASDPERASHRAFGLPLIEVTEDETDWPKKLGIDLVKTMRVDRPGELPRPMDPVSAGDLLSEKDGYEMSEADQQVRVPGHLQLVGHFLLDRDGVVRWSFTEVEDEGENLCQALNSEELMSAASQIAH
ncbi:MULTISPECIES: redoxin family protein [unclassified Ensifer]|uniref:redoxin family protein n=1 Tax=unclassified Ensifer TaxID=2633371 RepID=UPI000813C0F3|nr:MULTISPECIES: redoxin family protein [unclassified Ensifer]OCP01833.1 peroxiredoxin [Ensifer sp. LC14]OCP04572.1 peroxiredoxin [Ensifer sp. LC11]OCP09622.1 peroxiredoxin [Ensifer sp. LC13]OCP30669.1 peroxiredoxin [Ensifer sp. LC499]